MWPPGGTSTNGATEGKHPNLVIAALLHDAIEDCEVPHELVEGAFGTDVADLVMEVTDA
jgi:GTP diphosphokinase / guanosine-3',5'-bis(diphosphate) 3'-diphosphatase